MDVDGGTIVFGIDNELWIVDASTPSAMSLVSHTPLPYFITDLKVAGSYVYICMGGGLHVFDISSPLTPTEVGLLTLYSGISLDIVGSLVYLANNGYGIQVVDVSTPSSPTPRGTTSGYYFKHTVVRGNYAYAAGYYTFGVVDISDPDAPVVVASHALPGDPEGISEENGIAAVALLGSQAELFDVSTPSAPVAIGNTGGVYPSRAWEVAADGGVIIVAAEGDGVQVLPGHCAAPSAVPSNPFSPDASLSLWPNPFNPTTTIRFEVPRESDVTLRIYDVSGRLVRALVEARQDARVHEISWDGTDNAGRRVASGVYFCKLTVGASVEVRKTVLVK
jgi:hypothetical protein